MKKTTVIASMMMLFFSVASLAQDEASMKSKIDKIANDIATKLVKGESTLDYYADDAISLPSGQPMIQGIEALKANMEQNMNSGMKFTAFNLNVMKVMVSGNMVTEIGTYSLTMNVPGMPAPISDNGKYVNIWEIQGNGDLKLKVETWNTDIAPSME